MDEQGIDKALMFPAAAHDIEYEFADNIDALYANIRAFNRWMHEEVGFVADNRMWLPPYISFADPDLAVKELEHGHRPRRHHDPDQVGPRARRRATTRSAVGRWPIPCSTGSGASATRPASASRCTSAAPTTRSTAPTGRRTPRPCSATSTPSSG